MTSASPARGIPPGCDTFPKLLDHVVTLRGERPAFREKHLGIWQTSRCRSTRTPSPRRWPTCSTTPRPFAVVRGPGAGRQAAVDAEPLPAAGAHRLRRAARPADYDQPAALLREVQEQGRARALATPTSSRDARDIARGRAPTSHHPLHLRHDRPPKGVMLSHDNVGDRRRRERRLRRARRATRRSSPTCRSPGSATTSSPTRRPILAGFCVNCPEAARRSSRTCARSGRPTSSRRRASSRTCSPW
jgi:hypothetical protein